MIEPTARKILIVEDEFLIAMLVEQMAQDIGYEVAAIVSTVDEALSFLERASCDCAILDMNLGHGVESTPVANALRTRGIPFLFASGYGTNSSVKMPLDAPILSKPFLTNDLQRALHGLFP